MTTVTMDKVQAEAATGRVRRPRAAASTQRADETSHTGKAGKNNALRQHESKTEIVLKKLRAGKGASIAQLGEVTGWQPHSVRGFLSATVRKKLGLDLTSEVGKDGIRRYRVTLS